MSRPSRLGCALAVVGICLGLCGLSNYGSSGPPIEIVLPDGYTGPVCLIEDKVDGAEIALVDGRYLVEMPANCRLRVKTLDQLQRWHTETMRYANGRIVPDESSVSSPDPSRVMLRMSNCGVTNSGPVHVEMFVGTDKQVGEFIRGPRPPLD